jgi:hypothetical protein
LWREPIPPQNLRRGDAAPTGYQDHYLPWIQKLTLTSGDADVIIAFATNSESCRNSDRDTRPAGSYSRCARGK